MDFINGLIVVAGILNLFAGMVIFLYGKKSKINYHFVGLIFSVFLWTLAVFFLRTDGLIYASLWTYILYCAPLGIATFFLHFTMVFPRTVLYYKVISICVISSTFVLALLIIFTDWIIVGSSVTSAVGSGVTFGKYYFLFAGFLSITFLLAFLALVMQYIQAYGSERKKIRYVIIGASIPVGIGISTNLLLPLFGIFTFDWIGQVSSVFTILMMAQIVAKHNLLNTKVLGFRLFGFAVNLVAFLEVLVAKTVGEFIIRIFFFSIIAFSILTLLKGMRREIAQKEELKKMTRRLERANHELKKLDTAKSDFISIASHQLRTPLTAIKGYISLVSEGAYGPTTTKVQGALDKIYLSNERLIQLVEDLLNTSRIESGRMDYRFEIVNVTDIVKGLEDTFILRTRNKGLEFTILALSDEPIYIKADVKKIREVVSNLIDNAVKYTKSGFVRVRVEQKKDIVHIIIEDSGIGIPSETLRRLFSKFSRGEDTAHLHVEGTGLGLYVGKNIIEKHAGRIIARSRGRGKGSRFIVELPIYNDKQKKDKKSVLKKIPSMFKEQT